MHTTEPTQLWGVTAEKLRTSWTAWDHDALTAAAALYTSGASLAAVAARFGVDASIVANRFRRAGVAVRPRRGWA